ncbi:MAG: tandem-95 repeat protein, partial [Deltaproteobacteria bacterium]|nr:tandem-95 repeat protein [Deltaproteobacteria bacterium]
DDDADGDTLTVAIVHIPHDGTAVVNADKKVIYTPDDDFFGIDSFLYRVSDGKGASDVAIVVVTVAGENDAPVAVDDDAWTLEAHLVVVNVLANDVDVDGDTLTVTIGPDPTNGSATLNANGTVTYTPDDDFDGTDTFTYTINDGTADSAEATVTIVVSAVNDPPLAVDDQDTTDEDTPVVVDVLDNDDDEDGDTLTVAFAASPVHGTAVVETDQTVTYTPAAHFNGTDSFLYQVIDGRGGSDVAIVEITVSSDNDPPVAVDDAARTQEDQTVDVDVLENDIDVDFDILTVTIEDDPTDGTATVNADETVTYTPDLDFDGTDTFTYTINDGTVESTEATVTITVDAENDPPVAVDDTAVTNEDTPVVVVVLDDDTDADQDTLSVAFATLPVHGTVLVAANGTITYTPNDDFNGDDAFLYEVIDGQGGSDVAIVEVTVDPVNDAPVAADDGARTDEERTIAIAVLANDTDVDGDSLTVTIVANPGDGLATVNTDQTVSYTPNAQFNGTDTFTYTANDGTTDSADATVTIIVGIVNDGPVAVDDMESTDEDTPLIIDVLDNDTDADESLLTVAFATTPDHGSTAVNVDGTVTYTPEADFSGSDAFLYQVVDGQGGADVATVKITVVAVNDAPVAEEDSVLTRREEAVTVDVLRNDNDVDGDLLTVEVIVLAANGTVSVEDDETVTYTPDDRFSGYDAFTYQVDDGNGGTDSAEVQIGVLEDLADEDGDGLPDQWETDNGLDPTTDDSDGDGLTDGEEVDSLADPADSDGDGTIDALDDDSDDDSVLDGADNCPLTWNFDQEDTDGDGLGDACDDDVDGDDVRDWLDNCPMDANPSQADTDADGRGDVCDEAEGCTCGSPSAPSTWSVLLLGLLAACRRRRRGACQR